MTTAELVIDKIMALPSNRLEQVLDFVDVMNLAC